MCCCFFRVGVFVVFSWCFFWLFVVVLGAFFRLSFIVLFVCVVSLGFFVSVGRFVVFLSCLLVFLG